MPLKTLVVIVLRLFTIYLIVEGIQQLSLLFPMLWAVTNQGEGVSILPVLYSSGAYMLALFFIAIILWISAFRLSSLATKGHEADLSFVNLSKTDLYDFAFVFLGIIFFLSAIPSTVQSAYKFFTFDLPLPNDNPQRGRYLWPFLGYLFQLVTGFLCVYRAQHWRRKLIPTEESTSPPDSGEKGQSY